jgi:hypothetical protein
VDTVEKALECVIPDSEKIAGCHEVRGASARKTKACPVVWLYSSGNRKLQALE